MCVLHQIGISTFEKKCQQGKVNIKEMKCLHLLLERR